MYKTLVYTRVNGNV